MSATKKQRANWTDGAAARGNMEMLRDEVQDLRDLLWGVLLLLGVPADKVYQHKFAGSRAAVSGRERGATVIPLRDLPLSRKAAEEARNRYDVVTLHDLVREVPRSEVARWPGMGDIRMAKLDAAVSDARLSWAIEP